MSDKLAISAALSVLMMACFVLFGTDSTRAPLHGGSGDVQVSVRVFELPGLRELLPFLR
jgi:hypothetical protein